MEDQSATSLNLHVLETSGLIRQLLILLQNQKGIVRIKDGWINRLVWKDRHVFATKYLPRRKLLTEGGALAGHPRVLNDLRALVNNGYLFFNDL